jgi:hypothetical protein
MPPGFMVAFLLCSMQPRIQIPLNPPDRGGTFNSPPKGEAKAQSQKDQGNNTLLRKSLFCPSNISSKMRYTSIGDPYSEQEK